MNGRNNYDYYKARHRCVMCHKQDAYTLAGRVYCAECAEWRSEYYRKRRQDPEYRRKASEYYSSYRKAWEAQRIAEGRCLTCQRLVSGPYKHCAVCRAKARERYKAAHRQDDGLCWRCQQEPRLEGRKLGEKCYRKMLEISKLGAEARARKRSGYRKGGTDSDGDIL